MVIFTIGTYGVNSLILGWCGSVCGREWCPDIANFPYSSYFLLLLKRSTSIPASLQTCRIEYLLTSLIETKEKKSASIAIVTTIMNASFIWTPYLWPKSDEPRYAM